MVAPVQRVSTEPLTEAPVVVALQALPFQVIDTGRDTRLLPRLAAGSPWITSWHWPWYAAPASSSVSRTMMRFFTESKALICADDSERIESTAAAPPTVGSPRSK